MRRYEDEAGLGAGAGIPMLWRDQKGSGDMTLHTVRIDEGEYRLWMQDRFEYDAAHKWTAFLAGLAESGAEKDDLAVHFLSTKGTATYGHPYSFARELNAKLLETPCGELSGWIILDYLSPALAAHVYESNF